MGLTYYPPCGVATTATRMATTTARKITKAKIKGCLYCTPLKKTPDDPEKSRFSAVPVGSIKLLAEAGIEGNNNDSLCATRVQTWGSGQDY